MRPTKQVQQLTESVTSLQSQVSELQQKVNIYSAENERLKRITDLQHSTSSTAPSTTVSTP